MKPLLTRACARNAPAVPLIVALGLGTAGAGPALARAAPPGPAPQAAAVAAAPAPWRPQADLVITFRESPSAPERRWTLTCDPVGGTLPHPWRVCRVLREVWNPYLPVRVGEMCPLVVYGPQVTTITGSWYGLPISARFSRTFSCQASRWYRILAVLPPDAGLVNPGGPMKPGPPGQSES